MSVISSNKVDILQRKKNLRFATEILFFLNIQIISLVWPGFNKQVICWQLSETQRKTSCQVVLSISKNTRKAGGGEREDKLIKHVLREHTNTPFTFKVKKTNFFL